MDADRSQSYSEIKTRIEKLCSELGRVPPTLIAVSKTKPIEDIERLYHLGQRDFGENYVQELVEKAKQATERGLSDIRWHFIGHLQKNKIKLLLPVVDSIHSVDSVELARKLNEACETSRRANRLPVFLQVNIDDEESKSGFNEVEVVGAAAEIKNLHRLRLDGLMTIPRPGGSKRAFQKMRSLVEALSSTTECRLSMGMSSDFEEAIREGSTHLRLGTVLFGERR